MTLLHISSGITTGYHHFLAEFFKGVVRISRDVSKAYVKPQNGKRT